jgi:hypothetical protein
VKPAVQIVRALPVCAAPAKEMAVGVVAAPIVTFAAGLAAVGSSLVWTVNFVFVNVAAGGFVMPATVNAPDWPATSAHDAPLIVTVKVEPETVPVALQLE